MNKIIKVIGKNMYPFSRENFDTVIDFYFRENGIDSNCSNTELDKVYNEMKVMKLFEFEFVVNCIIDNIKLFKDNIHVLHLSNLCLYGLDAFNGNLDRGSKNRTIITSQFRELLEKSCL